MTITIAAKQAAQNLIDSGLCPEHARWQAEEITQTAMNQAREGDRIHISRLKRRLERLTPIKHVLPPP